MDVQPHVSFASARSQLLPLSGNQLDIWHAHASNPQDPSLSIAEYLDLAGALHPTKFIQAVGRAVTETEALHLCFRETPQGPCQFLAEKIKWVLAFLDETAEPDPFAAAKKWMQEDVCQFVDIKEGPLFSVALFRCDVDRHLYYFRCHRILAGNFDRYLLSTHIADFYSASLDAAPIQARYRCLNPMYRPRETCSRL